MHITQNIHQILNQLNCIISKLNNEEYTQEITIINNQTIGKHTRHILEFFIELLNHNEFVCYDQRKRDINLETSITYALNTITDINKQIEILNINQKIIFRQLINNETISTESTIGREMIYCIDHGIHHFAIIKIALKDTFPQFNIDDNFGVAYSTIKYRNN